MNRALSIRTRLTLWWGALFFVFGLLLLGATFVIVVTAIEGLADEVRGNVVRELEIDEHQASEQGRSELGDLLSKSPTDPILGQPIRRAIRWIRTATLFALALLAAAAAVAGWFVAGRMLAPVRTITDTARRISETNLSDRIASEGPQDELRTLADAFDAMLERLGHGFDAQQAFTADASHELRTPLTLIRAELDVTLADPDVGEQERADAADSVRETLDHVEQLLDRLLQLASAEVIHDRQRVPLDELVRTSVGAHVSAGDALELQLDLRAADALAEPTLLGRLVDNLVQNAVRHNRPSGWIQATTATSGDRVQLVVANSGPALTDDELARLTDRFYRPDPSRARQTGGTGLGLAIVSTIVRAHHGTLRLAPVLGGGLDVHIELPAAPDAAG